MNETTVTVSGVVDTFLLLLIGIGPKLVLVPLLQVNARLDPETRARVRRRMMATAATTAVALVVLGELLRRLLHFSVGSLSVAGGTILLVSAVRIVLENGESTEFDEVESDPMKLAMVPLAVPYLLNPVGIVGLVTISAEAGSIGVLAVEIAILGAVLVLDAFVFRIVERRSTINVERMLVVEKVFGFLIAAIAAQLIFDGLYSLGIIRHLNH
ncbi:MAG TPA: MarC family protein [Gaiellaceae bacterium]